MRNWLPDHVIEIAWFVKGRIGTEKYSFDVNKAVGAGGGPGPDRLDRLVLVGFYMFLSVWSLAIQNRIACSSRRFGYRRRPGGNFRKFPELFFNFLKISRKTPGNFSDKPASQAT